MPFKKAIHTYPAAQLFLLQPPLRRQQCNIEISKSNFLPYQAAAAQARARTIMFVLGSKNALAFTVNRQQSFE